MYYSYTYSWSIARGVKHSCMEICKFSQRCKYGSLVYRVFVFNPEISTEYMKLQVQWEKNGKYVQVQPGYGIYITLGFGWQFQDITELSCTCGKRIRRITLLIASHQHEIGDVYTCSYSMYIAYMNIKIDTDKHKGVLYYGCDSWHCTVTRGSRKMPPKA